ncbi:hypothetical protein FPOA_00439 [Fusarium poae]|uniref:Uncharacterized protein n=1 Tax=Fusarium poae TaxID=36050 RepID=A0A1B8B1A2_FUSPO|nr:hypothetical protein FPOA_00439 [Fusarium poae]
MTPTSPTLTLVRLSCFTSSTQGEEHPARYRPPRIGEITDTARIPNYRQLQSQDLHCIAYPLLSLAQALTAVTSYVTRSIRICIRIRTRRSTTFEWILSGPGF